MKALRHLTIAAFFCFLLAGAMYMHGVGTPERTQMDDYFIKSSQEETGANNVVTGILFDYRGFDTLGEASVLFAAASGVILLFRRKRNEQ